MTTIYKEMDNNYSRGGLTQMDITPAVRILPMNRSKEFPEYDLEGLQQQFFLRELPSRAKVDFRYHTGLNAEHGTVILFQSDSKIIASATLLESKRFNQPDSEGYKGCLYLDLVSIKVFDPIPEDIIIRIWPEVTKLRQVKWSLNPEGYVEFERELRNVRTPADRFAASEDNGDWRTGDNIAKGFPQNVNSIPGEPTDQCYPILMVAIGSVDSIEARMLEAAYHVNVSCPGKNKIVIFEAAKWESEIWRKHAKKFVHVEVILRIKGTLGEMKL